MFDVQAEDGIRDLVRSRGLGDVYKRQDHEGAGAGVVGDGAVADEMLGALRVIMPRQFLDTCLLYPSDAADERSSVDLGGRSIIKKKNTPPPPPRQLIFSHA